MIAMLNSRLLREQDAQLHFETMAYIIRQFGAPPRPAVPSPLHKTPGLESLAWDPLDTRSVFHWAQDYFGEIKSICHMSNLEAELFPEGDNIDADNMIANHRLDVLASGQIPYRITDAPSVIYDPSKCAAPGYFVATLTLQLADFRLSEIETDAPPSPVQFQKMRLTAAAYIRQGFMLANLPEQVSDCLKEVGEKRLLSQTLILDTLCFATCLALRVRRQSAEQIIATYGTRMTKRFRKKIPHACRQIDAQGEALAVLQMLAEPRARQRAALSGSQLSG